MFFFALNKPLQRLIPLILGALIIYHVRPHIMLVTLVSIVISFTFSTKGVSGFVRFSVLAVAGIAFFFIYKDVLTMVGIDEEEFVSQGVDLSHRAFELSKAGSGIDISNYSIPMLLFTFLYRPLFFDAPGVFGYIVSFENLFYLIITFRLLSFSGLRFLFTSNYVVKTALFSFLSVSLALAQISGNLGLAMRQKSQIMILLMFVIIMYLDDVKFKQYRSRMARKMKMKKMEEIAAKNNLNPAT